jgi:hypothetical protein
MLCWTSLGTYGLYDRRTMSQIHGENSANTTVTNSCDTECPCVRHYPEYLHILTHLTPTPSLWVGGIFTTLGYWSRDCNFSEASWAAVMGLDWKTVSRIGSPCCKHSTHCLPKSLAHSPGSVGRTLSGRVACPVVSSWVASLWRHWGVSLDFLDT